MFVFICSDNLLPAGTFQSSFLTYDEDIWGIGGAKETDVYDLATSAGNINRTPITDHRLVQFIFINLDLIYHHTYVLIVKW